MSVRVVRPNDARASRLDRGERRYVLHDYFGSHARLDAGPQVYEVDLETPHGTIPPHYHEVDQYQVVVGGSGRIGRHPLPVGAVHYTDRYTTYGPIRSAGARLSFFTLRKDPVLGARFMPESRGRKRVRSGQTFTGVAELTVPGSTRATRELGSTGAGALARELRLPPGVPVGNDGRTAAGLYLVLAGSLLQADDSLPVRTCLHVEHDGEPLDAVGGSDGSVVVHLGFPR